MAGKTGIMGNNMDRIPDIGFKAMSFMFVIRDILVPASRKVDRFGIKQGDTVIDYGCGPGGYIERASELAGAGGKVYAADIHELAISAVRKRIQKKSLNNVEAVQIIDYHCPVSDRSADIIYALDMFHMVKHPDRFLKELHRLMKKGGRLIIEDGHQPRKESREKIIASGLWKIIEDNRRWLVCVPR